MGRPPPFSTRAHTTPEPRAIQTLGFSPRVASGKSGRLVQGPAGPSAKSSVGTWGWQSLPGMAPQPQPATVVPSTQSQLGNDAFNCPATATRTISPVGARDTTGSWAKGGMT